MKYSKLSLKDIPKLAQINRIVLNIIEMQEIINNPEIKKEGK
jgi:hypothetical protein